MPEGMKFNPNKIEEERKETDAIVRLLEKQGATVEPDKMDIGSFAYKIQFTFPEEEATVSIRLALKEWQSDSDLVITNMTTLPDSQKGKGLGSRVIKTILDWARGNGLKEVRATQVSSEDSARFWEKNGFTKMEEPNPHSDYLFYIDRKE